MAIPGFTAHRSLHQLPGYGFRKKETLPSGAVKPALSIEYTYDGFTYIGGDVGPGGPETGGGGAHSGDQEDLVLKGICIRRCRRRCNTNNTNTACFRSCFNTCYY
jgi:hypothetical protein